MANRSMNFGKLFSVVVISLLLIGCNSEVEEAATSEQLVQEEQLQAETSNSEEPEVTEVEEVATSEQLTQEEQLQVETPNSEEPEDVAEVREVVTSEQLTPDEQLEALTLELYYEYGLDRYGEPGADLTTETINTLTQDEKQDLLERFQGYISDSRLREAFIESVRSEAEKAETELERSAIMAGIDIGILFWDGFVAGILEAESLEDIDIFTGGINEAIGDFNEAVSDPSEVP